MYNNSFAQISVEKFAQELPEARAYLREARIDSTARMRLVDAAMAASVTPDELLAQIDARIRRQARKAASRPAPVMEHAEEFELV
ncbi:MAG: hypothetical protein OHK0015_10720 [Chloroflexi bacterium OHK40]